MKGLVLAAGYGTRLYPLTLDRPKGLLPVAGRPILEWLLASLEPVAMDELYLVTNSKFAPHFRDWAAGYPGDVAVLDDGTASEDERRGAIGDIGFVLDETGIDDDLVVVAFDNLFSEPLEGFAERCREVAAPVVAVYDVGDLEAIKRYNAIEIDGAGRVTYFEEKPAEPRSTLTGIALYHYPREALPLVGRYLEEGGNPDQPGRLVEWLYTRTPVYTWRVPGVWYDIGSRETLEEADRVFSARAAR